MTIKVLGIDIAKNTFQLHGADDAGKAVLKKRLLCREFASMHHKAAVALANKNARIIWSLLNSGEEFNYGVQTAAA